MRAFDSKTFNNESPYNLIDRMSKACALEHIEASVENEWVILPTLEAAEALAEEVMKELKEEHGNDGTVRLSGNALWEMCAWETE